MISSTSKSVPFQQFNSFRPGMIGAVSFFSALEQPKTTREISATRLPLHLLQT